LERRGTSVGGGEEESERGWERERTNRLVRARMGWVGRESVVTAEKPKGGGFEIAHERESGSERGIEPKGKTRANRRASESESAPRRKRHADRLRNEEMGRGSM